jgi:hypothetical protein
MDLIVRWAVLAACVLVVIGMIAYARGAKHHHGDDVGSHGVRVTVVVPR